MRTTYSRALLGFLIMWCGTGDADDWPQWLGPHRKPIWSESGILKRFPKAGPTLRWKTAIGGGYSGPAVANGRVFLMDRMTNIDDLKSGKKLPGRNPYNNDNFVRRFLPGKERIVCLRESDGKQLWNYEYDCPYTTVATYAIGPRCTPTVDGKRVFCLGAEGHLTCLNVSDGKVVWVRNLQEEYRLKMPWWGMAAHPLVDGDRLICMVGGAGTTCVAFDKRTGKELWRALTAQEPGYCPPVIYEVDGERQLIVWHSDSVDALNPKTGQVFWSVPFKATFAMAIGAPQLSGRSLFLMGFSRKSAMIEIAANRRSAIIVWRGSTATGIDGVLNTPVIHDGHIYACGNGGRYICAKLATGERLWSTFAPSSGKRPIAWGNVFTIRNGNRFFHANDLGDLIIAQMTPQGYTEISRAHLIDPTHEVSGRKLVWSHPAFANRSIYLRNDQEVRCYSLAGRSVAKSK